MSVMNSAMQLIIILILSILFQVSNAFNNSTDGIEEDVNKLIENVEVVYIVTGVLFGVVFCMTCFCYCVRR